MKAELEAKLREALPCEHEDSMLCVDLIRIGEGGACSGCDAFYAVLQLIEELAAREARLREALAEFLVAASPMVAPETSEEDYRRFSAAYVAALSALEGK